MIKKILTYLAVTAGIASTALGSFLIVTKMMDLLINKMDRKPRITEINVWNGPVPTHPSQL